MGYKKGVLLGGIVLALIAAAFLVANSASAAGEPTTKNIRFTGSGEDHPIDEDVFCDVCVPDVFVDGAGALYLRFALNTELSLVGATSLTVDPPEGPLNQGSVIPVNLTLAAKEDAAKEVKITLEAKATVQIEENWPGGDAHGDVLLKLNPTLGPFTLLEKDMNALHSGQEATLSETVESPSLVDPCEGILNADIDKGLGEIGVGLNCDIKLGWQTTAHLTGNGITADRSVEVKDIPPILITGGELDFPKGTITDKFEIPCDAPASSFIDYALTGKQYGVDATATGKGLLIIDFSTKPIDVLDFLGIPDPTINLFDLFGIDPFNTFEGKVVATKEGEDKPTISLGQVSKDKEQPFVNSVTISGTQVKGQPVTFTAAGKDNCNSGAELHYKWVFDDGGVAFGPTVNHVFTSNGTHSGTVQVTDKAGNVAYRDFTVAIGIGNPTVSPIPNPGPTEWGVPIEFSGFGFDPSGADPNSLKYLWDFGDGTSAINQKVSHSYDKPGTYEVSLTVTTSQGGETTVTRDVTITKRDTHIENCGPVQVVQSANKVGVCLRLVDSQKEQVISRTLAYQFFTTSNTTTGPSVSRSGFTDATGTYQASINIATPNGCYRVRTSFNGASDNLYDSSTYDFIFYSTAAVNQVQPCTLVVPAPTIATLDVNCDGGTNAVDALYVMQVVAGLASFVSCSNVANVNGDGVINALDALYLLQLEAGLIELG